MIDLNQQIAAAEARRQQALQAEQQRQANEQAARQAIAQSEADLARLAAQKIEAAINDRIKTAQDAADGIEAMGQELIAALQAFNIPAAMLLGERITAYVTGLANFNKQTLADAKPLLDRTWDEAVQQARNQARAAGWPIGDRRTDDLAMAAFNAYKVQLEQRLPSAPDFVEQIRSWVQAVEPGKQRQIRQGIAYALTGWFCDPPADQMLGRWARTTY